MGWGLLYSLFGNLFSSLFSVLGAGIIVAKNEIIASIHRNYIIHLLGKICLGNYTHIHWKNYELS